jgi:hypothetical protein
VGAFRNKNLKTQGKLFIDSVTGGLEYGLMVIGGNSCTDPSWFPYVFPPFLWVEGVTLSYEDLMTYFRGRWVRVSLWLCFGGERQEKVRPGSFCFCGFLSFLWQKLLSMPSAIFWDTSQVPHCYYVPGSLCKLPHLIPITTPASTYPCQSQLTDEAWCNWSPVPQWVEECQVTVQIPKPDSPDSTPNCPNLLSDGGCYYIVWPKKLSCWHQATSDCGRDSEGRKSREQCAHFLKNVLELPRAVYREY